MSQYVAVLRLSDLARSELGRSESARADLGRTDGAASGVRPRLLQLAGVESVQLDRVAGALLVWFNRGQVSLADLVRAVEDAGVSVCGVAQGRADAGEQARVAIA